MRLKDVEINLQSGTIELNTFEVDKPCMIVIAGGKVRMTELPTHGGTTVVTHQGKVKRVTWDEGEEF
ncbi:XtrA/YqaO family protein [Alkalicoccobacillus gibsonii]|uniref:XtrA/YqaO family protein n=1 Tax=Alkalicoccobacillus gibsonii TaxID=79881 RepID=UPI00193178E7|nr:XtrA/YqaO family protein [Alkalicoccobacillus gibsonii]MBM0064949.1 XtrA/YqaO family protein [Alkalicoccobacillus gibsonii]